MKRFTIFLGVLTIGISLSSAATPAQLYKTVGGNPSGYIFDSSPTAIVFATPSETSPKQTVKLTELKGVGLKRGVRLTAREDILAEARAAFSSGNQLKPCWANITKRLLKCINYGLCLERVIQQRLKKRFRSTKSL